MYLVVWRYDMGEMIRSVGTRELSVLHVVWEKGEATVRDVFKEISKDAEIAYTTILTIMKNLEKKHMLEHRVSDRAHVYRATVKREEIQGSFLRDLVQNVFKNSHRDLVNALVQSGRIGSAELRALIDELGEKDT
jgi:BlaI family transcriptional regulator, penicillinase repressor